jgi:hypothetical protein
VKTEPGQQPATAAAVAKQLNPKKKLHYGEHKIYFAIGMGGEGATRGFLCERNAREWAEKEEGAVCEKMMFGSPRAVPFVIPGTPESIYVVGKGDRGCTVAIVGAHLELAVAEADAVKKQKSDKRGLSAYTYRLDLVKASEACSYDYYG